MTVIPCLLAVVEVDKDDRIICQAKGCGHAVYKRIHVVRDKDGITVVGSECFKRLYGELEYVSNTPMFGSSEGRRLSEEERAALLENTERLVAAFEAEHLEAQRIKEAQRAEAEKLKTMARENTSTGNGRFGRYHRSAYRGAPAAVNILTGVPDSELAKIRVEAKAVVQAENPGLNLDAPGWKGLIEAEVRRIVRRRKNG